MRMSVLLDLHALLVPVWPACAYDGRLSVCDSASPNALQLRSACDPPWGQTI